MKLSELSIADLKAALDHVKDLQTERANDLRRESPSIDLKNETGMRDMANVIFKLHHELDNRIFKLPI